MSFNGLCDHCGPNYLLAAFTKDAQDGNGRLQG